MPTKKDPRSSKDKSISINGDVRDSTVIIGDNNTVSKTTIIQKFFNIFKSDSESLELRNRRILLNHVENAWIKGVLDASLHGAALLDLGIKQDPEAVIQYPWAIKKEATDETLPAGTSMLEIFDSIGMGRSLLILGAPGSGKTTMLLELARGLIARAREDVTQPIPMVFNLASWTEKLTLADWLAQELNNLYSVPRKTAPDWVKGNKLLLLLDGLDEVRQDSRAKCVEAINEFRKQNGLTSLAVCSRSQDYADLNAKLSFEGAIEVQPLTQEQITEFFNRFVDEMAGIKQMLEDDNSLREMAETPLFLSIMIIANRDKENIKNLMSNDLYLKRKHLLNSYIARMLIASHARLSIYEETDLVHWLSWLSHKMKQNNMSYFFIENIQPDWVSDQSKLGFHLFAAATFGFLWMTVFMISVGLLFGLIEWVYYGSLVMLVVGWITALPIEIVCGLIPGVVIGLFFGAKNIRMVDSLKWDWGKAMIGFFIGLPISFILGPSLFLLAIFTNYARNTNFTIDLLPVTLGGVVVCGPVISILCAQLFGWNARLIDKNAYPGQIISNSIKNSLWVFITMFLSTSVHFIFIYLLSSEMRNSNTFLTILLFWISGSTVVALVGGLLTGGFAVIQHFTLRLFLFFSKKLPLRFIPFLDHCVDLIFLRRVGGGYIFIHRLLMEHFAEMYAESPTSKGN